jgi:hypothetical protein
MGHLPNRSRLAGAARSKTDVFEGLTADRLLVLRTLYGRKGDWVVAYKAGPSAPLTSRGTAAFPEIEPTGGKVARQAFVTDKPEIERFRGRNNAFGKVDIVVNNPAHTSFFYRRRHWFLILLLPETFSPHIRG